MTYKKTDLRVSFKIKAFTKTDSGVSFFVNHKMAQPDRGWSPMLIYLVVILLIIFIIGIIGFRFFFNVGWIDAFFQTGLATSTLGLSATSVAETNSQKLFLVIYALTSSIIFLGIASHLVSEFIRMHDEKLKNEALEQNQTSMSNYVPSTSRYHVIG